MLAVRWLFIFFAAMVTLMCTYIIYSNPGGDVPLMLAMTRDENPARATQGAFEWKDPAFFTDPVAVGKMNLHFLGEKGVQGYIDAGIVAPRDSYLGGTYIAQNKHGVVAAINNRRRVPKTKKAKLKDGVSQDMSMMSRGGLPLDAVSFATAKEAVDRLWPAIKEHQASEDRKYNGFNLLIADDKDVYVITNAIPGDITVDNDTRLEFEKIGGFELALWKLPPGKVSMLASLDPDDFGRSVRTQDHLPAFNGDKPGVGGVSRQAPKPGDFASWHWVVRQMAYRDDYKADPFMRSICQPDPAHPATGGKGYPDWVTVGANFLLTAKKQGGGLHLDWFELGGQILPGHPASVCKVERGVTHRPARMVIGDDAIRPHDPEVPKGPKFSP